MSVTQTAEDRLALLEPAPGDDGPESSAVAADGTSRAGEEPEEGPAPGTTKGAVRTTAQLALVMVALLAIGLVVQILIVSPVLYRSSQTSLLNTFRTELALGTAPIGPATTDGHPLPIGTPIALVEIPSLGVHSVVLEGTTGSVLTHGPGLLRDSAYPGTPGTSVLLGRATAYGGPFGRISEVHRGEQITVVTQVGTAHFRVTDVRHAGSSFRPPAADTARLTLGTATGSSWVPTGVVWVDATKVGVPFAVGSPPKVTLLAAERPLAVDTSTLWAVLLWVGVLAALVTGAVWSWRRWGRAQAWIVFTAPLLLAWSRGRPGRQVAAESAVISRTERTDMVLDIGRTRVRTSSVDGTATRREVRRPAWWPATSRPGSVTTKCSIGCRSRWRPGGSPR